MRKAIGIIMALVLISCMQKQADGTYRVTNPVPTDTAKARSNAEKAGDQVKQEVKEIGKSDAAQKIKAGSKELGKGVEEGVGHAAQVAGEKLQKAGKKAEDAAKH